MFSRKPPKVKASTAMDPQGITRPLRPIELREEWQKVVYLTWATRNAATESIIAKTGHFMAGPIHDRYELDVYKKYDSIVKLTTDEDISNGAKENRPCHNGFSALHKLDYDHLAYSEIHPIACGKNCKVPIVNSKLLFCVPLSGDRTIAQKWG
jgi:hypothetical protein